jgi:hypothetical protein
MDKIICPSCGKEIEISSALSKQMEEEIIANERLKHEKELNEVKKRAIDESTKKLREEFTTQLKDLSESANYKEERIKELLEKREELSQKMHDLKREKEDLKVDMLKQLASEEEKIRNEAQKKAEEEQHGKIAEKDKQLTDALKELEDMRRKLQQGSQQTQGEAFELEFENLLHLTFPNDKISPVGKGVRGADIVQEVWDSKGNYNGKILWELKNTKTWQEGWIEKLKADKRTINAQEAVIISEILPVAMTVAGYHNGIWVTNRTFVITLASTLRAKLIEVFYAKQSVQAKDGKMELMYTYLSGTEFKHRIEAIVEAFTNMQNEIEKEKRYFMNKWSRDEKNIRMVIDNTFGMHGDLKAIIGRTLPQIKGLDDIEYDTKDVQLQISDENDENNSSKL